MKQASVEVANISFHEQFLRELILEEEKKTVHHGETGGTKNLSMHFRR